jgi:type VI secretion system protein ImpH
MAAPERIPHAALIESLAREGPTYEFYRAVQLLHRLAPGRVPVGGVGPASEEPIRFSHDPSLVFHAGDIGKIEPLVERGDRRYARITTTFLGLLGAASPLASFLTEGVLRAEADEDASLRDFYDIFQHRVLSLLFRAWKKHRIGAGFRSDASDPFSRRALALVGVDVAGSVSRLGLPGGDLLAIAPLVLQRTRPARTLRIVLERLLPGAKVRIESFVARRVRIAEEQRVQLGVRNTTLGEDLTIGRHVLDRSGAFRVVIGPVEYGLYEAFLPGGRHHERLRRIVDQFSGGILEPELELHLDEAATPRFQIGAPRGAILGRNTQLSTANRPASRVRLHLSDDPARAKPRLVLDGDDD